MAYSQLLLVAQLIAVVLNPAAIASAVACVEGGAASGLCVDAGASGGSTSISGSTSDPGAGGPSPEPDGGDASGGSPDDGHSDTPNDPTAIIDDLGTCLDPERCRGNGDEAGTPAITLTDLASFSPTAPSIEAEPDGWALRGRPMNAIASTSVNTHDGTLLGHPVTVRFTPTAYHWDWGDGTTKTTSSAGQTWEALGLPRFSDTETSHTYTEKGTVTVTLAVDYTVEFQIDGGPWTAVTGTVDASSSENLYVGTATTVNVPGDCTSDPDGVGC